MSFQTAMGAEHKFLSDLRSEVRNSNHSSLMQLDKYQRKHRCSLRACRPHTMMLCAVLLR